MTDPHPHHARAASAPARGSDAADDGAPAWRSVTAGDAAGLLALMQGATQASRRQRFHAALRRAPPGWAECMARLPRRDGVMLVAAESARPGARLIAEAGYRIAPNRRSAAFALLVDDAWQRRGLGAWAMCALLHFAAVDGLRWLHGEVLTGNTPMIGLLAQQGYRWVGQEHEVLRAEREVPRAGVAGPAPWRGGSAATGWAA
jgi:acetyltransferase